MIPLRPLLVIVATLRHLIQKDEIDVMEYLLSVAPACMLPLKDLLSQAAELESPIARDVCYLIILEGRRSALVRRTLSLTCPLRSEQVLVNHHILKEHYQYTRRL